VVLEGLELALAVGVVVGDVWAGVAANQLADLGSDGAADPPEAAADSPSPGTRRLPGETECKVVINLERYGNTTAATIPLALADAVKDKRVKKGDLVLLTSVGAGFTVGAVVLRWSL